MTDFRRCACCSGRLEPAQQLRFLVETANLDDPAYLAGIRRMPSAKGRPVPVCRGCLDLLESAAPVPEAEEPYAAKKAGAVRAGMLAAVGLLSIGWLLQALILGPRA